MTMRPPVFRGTVGTACGLVILACTMPPREAPRGQPTGADWSAPVALTPMARGVVRSTDLALADPGPYIVDFSAPRVWRSMSGGLSRVPAPRLRIRSPGGGWIDPPAGRFTFAYPRIAVDDGGTLHLAWAEPDAGADTVDVTAQHFTAVWHAAWDGRRWTVPESLYRAVQIYWNPVQQSGVVADGDGRPQMAFAAIRGDGAGELVHLRREGAEWVRTNTPVPRGLPVYVHLAAGGRGQTTLAFVTAHNDSTGSHPNTLLVTRSTDGGVRWAEPVRVTQPGQSPAYEPRLAYGVGDTLHLVWTQHESIDAMESKALWHAVSEDGGATWGSPTLHLISGMTHQMQGVAVQCGGLHVVYADFARRNLVDLRVGAEAPPTPQTPFAPVAGDPVLRLGKDGTLHLVWTETNVSAADESVWHTRLVHSTRPGCGKEPEHASGVAAPP